MCKKDKELFCSLCVLQHYNHQEQLQIFTASEIIEHSKRLEKELNKQKKEIEESLINLQKIIEKK